jgi:hypothetical protein
MDPTGVEVCSVWGIGLFESALLLEDAQGGSWPGA